MKEEETPNIFPGQKWKVKEEKEEPTAQEIEQDFVSAKDIEAEKVKASLQNPGHTVEVDGKTPLSPTRKVALEDIRRVEEKSRPSINLAPQVDEKSQWQYTNLEGHGIRATVLDPIDDFNTRQKAEQRVLKNAGMEQRDYKVDMRDLTEEEREQIAIHNRQAGTLSIDPKKMERALEKEEGGFKFKAPVNPPKRKSALQIDMKNLYSSKAKWT